MAFRPLNLFCCKILLIRQSGSKSRRQAEEGLLQMKFRRPQRDGQNSFISLNARGEKAEQRNKRVLEAGVTGDLGLDQLYHSPCGLGPVTGLLEPLH